MEDTNRFPRGKYPAAHEIQKARESLCAVDMLKNDAFHTRKRQYRRLALARWPAVSVSKKIHVVVDMACVKCRRLRRLLATDDALIGAQPARCDGSRP